MLKKPPTKADLRHEIEAQINDFLGDGKVVNEITKGVSSRDGAEKPLRAESWQMDNKKSDWTYIPEVVNTLENRRQQKALKPSTATKTKRPHKRLIYDDFGEPLRWVWVDE